MSTANVSVVLSASTERYRLVTCVLQPGAGDILKDIVLGTESTSLPESTQGVHILKAQHGQHHEAIRSKVRRPLQVCT